MFSCRRCFSIDLHFVNVLTSTPPHSLGPKFKRLSLNKRLRQTPIFDNQFLIFNSEFRKKTSPFKLRFSKTNFHFPKHTPIFKIPFAKTNSHFLKETSIFQFNFLKTNSDFQQNKHRFFKSNSNVPLSFRTYTRLGVIRD